MAPLGRLLQRRLEAFACPSVLVVAPALLIGHARMGLQPSCGAPILAAEPIRSQAHSAGRGTPFVNRWLTAESTAKVNGCIISVAGRVWNPQGHRGESR